MKTTAAATTHPLPAEITALSSDLFAVTGEVKGARVYIRLRCRGKVAKRSTGDGVRTFGYEYVVNGVAYDGEWCKAQHSVMARVAVALAPTHAPGRWGFRGETNALYQLFDAR